jgi:hypothetical protein
VTERALWTCPTCGQPRNTPYCEQCGEEPPAPKDLTLRGLLEKGLHAVTSIDARVARTAWFLLREPGALTQAWTRGTRRQYVAPFQLFVIANVIFFALQWATGINVFSSTLDSHLHHQDWSSLAQSLLAARLDKTRVPLERYAPEFDRAVVLNAKSLIVLMALSFAPLLPLMFMRERRAFMVHVTFALHLYTFLLMLFCAALLAAKASEWLGVGGLDVPVVDTVLSMVNLAACAAYLYVAIGPVYQATGGTRVVKAVVLALAVAAIVLAYRFALFLITLYGT